MREEEEREKKARNDKLNSREREREEWRGI